MPHRLSVILLTSDFINCCQQRRMRELVKTPKKISLEESIMSIPKCRQWRLFVAESRRKYWLDNVPIASIVKRAELINSISPSVTDFCTFNEDTNKWLTVGELKTYCSRINEVND